MLPPEAVDGIYISDANNFWASRGDSPLSQWLEVDFGERKGIYRVAIMGRYIE